MQPAVSAAGFSWFYFLLIGLNRKYKGSLMAKHYVLAMLCIMAQIMFNPAWAEVTSPTTVTSTTSQDAIQTFAKTAPRPISKTVLLIPKPKAASTAPHT